MNLGTLNKVTSRDGTPIAFYRSGSGPPLILVPGAGAANPAAWTGVIPALEEQFTVYAVDRRGRGESGDAPEYALEREAEDIAALVDSTGKPAHVLGHSFGALCALEAALLTPNLDRLVLYEPWIAHPGSPLYPDGFIDRLDKQLDAGDREGALISLYCETAGLTTKEVAQMKSSPRWPARLATAHTLVREMRAEEGYEFDERRFQNLRSRILLLLGGDSSPTFRESTERLIAALPGSRIAVLPGQQHIAMYTASELFLHEVLGFLTRPGG